MTEQKSCRKLNIGRCREKVLQQQNAAGTVSIRGIVLVMALILGGPFTLSVKAEPATLRSPDATVYEQTSEGSNLVGNLVEGGSFEYIGDVTAEDGSVWHQITTAGGVNGYIRGDREMEVGAAQEPAPEDQGEPENPGNQEGQAPEGNGEPAGNPPGEEVQAGANPGEDPEAEAGRAAGEGAQENNGGDRSPTGAQENGTGEEGQEPQDGDGLDGEEAGDEGDSGEEDGVIPAFHMQNNQTKKYVVNNSQKIKERTSLVEIDAEFKDGKIKRVIIDKTLFVGLSVMLLCGGIIYICWTRMKLIGKGSGREMTVGGRAETGRSKTHSRKAERKRHSQKKKSTKIIQGKKRI